MIRTVPAALRFVAIHGIALESARGPVPNLACAIAGEPIRGNWWSHPMSHEIYRLTMAVRESPEVLVCRLVGGKITFAHRSVWPALVRIADDLGCEGLAEIHEEHTKTGAHRAVSVAFPRWVPKEIRAAARQMSRDDAIRMLRPILGDRIIQVQEAVR